MLILTPKPDQTYVLSWGNEELATITGVRCGGDIRLAINTAPGVRMSESQLIPAEEGPTFDQLSDFWPILSPPIPKDSVAPKALIEVFQASFLQAEFDCESDVLVTFMNGMTASVLAVSDGPWLKLMMAFPFRADTTELSALRLTNRLNKSGGSVFTTIGSELLVAVHFFDFSNGLRPSVLVETLDHWARGVRDSISSHDHDALVCDLPDWFV